MVWGVPGIPGTLSVHQPVAAAGVQDPTPTRALRRSGPGGGPRRSRGYIHPSTIQQKITDTPVPTYTARDTPFMRPPIATVLTPLLLSLVACDTTEVDRPAFDGAAALEYARQQLDFGPRIPGSEGHARMGDWLVQQMRERADTVVEQTWTHVTVAGDSLPMRNVLARFHPDSRRRILYVAHWDTRPISDKADAARRSIPVPGANDGASGVALLMAVADQLQAMPPNVGVDLLFVDGEDYGDFDRMEDVLIGSRWFAQNLPEADYQPMIGVVWDMIGDADLVIHQEGYSLRGAPEVVERVWRVAGELGHSSTFRSSSQGGVVDDHIPLLEVGLRVINVIDMNYPPHHTPDDTMDRISAASLQIVGEVAMGVIRGF